MNQKLISIVFMFFFFFEFQQIDIIYGWNCHLGNGERIENSVIVVKDEGLILLKILIE